MMIFKKIYNLLFYVVTWSLGTIVGWLPRFIWLLLADVLYVVLYRICRYRVGVTRRNLKASFPEKSDLERKWIERRFYLYLMDIFIETIVLVGISKYRINYKMKFENTEEFDEVCRRRSVIVTMAHYASWEWPIIYAMKSDSVLMPVYHSLKSPWADQLFHRMRSRFGAVPISMKLVGRKLIEMKDKRYILALIADQTPPVTEKTEWVTFLHQDTMFFNGAENLSRKYNLPVYFFDIECVRRGYYKGRFVKLYDGDAEVPQCEITRRYINILEQKIKNRPEFWMWSHKRWKHKKQTNEK